MPTEDLHLTFPWKLFLDTLLMTIRGKTISFAAKLKHENEEREKKPSERMKYLYQ